MNGKYFQLAAFLGFALLCVWVFSVINTPTIGTPDESRRLIHPAGFSVVGPVGWEGRNVVVSLGAGSPTMQFLPTRSVGVQPNFTIYQVDALPEPQDKLKRVETTFMGKPAFVSEGPVSNAYLYVIDVELEGKWYRLSLKLASREDVRGGAWWRYFESLRIERPALPATTLPTTMTVERP